MIQHFEAGEASRQFLRVIEPIQDFEGLSATETSAGLDVTGDSRKAV